MRIIIIFDLPTFTKSERKDASNFRKFLKDDGFQMLQFSVYVRICNGMGNVDTHKKRIKATLPSKGSVRMFIIPNKQYESAEVLVGNYSEQEKLVGKEQLILL